MRYFSQKNGLMDSYSFKNWIELWYSEVPKKSNGPWLLTMDNCGGHESEFALPGLRIELLPLRSTAKYQPLDLGLIAHRKICYRSNLLGGTINLMLKGNHELETFLRAHSKEFMVYETDSAQLLEMLWRYLMNCGMLHHVLQL